MRRVFSFKGTFILIIQLVFVFEAGAAGPFVTDYARTAVKSGFEIDMALHFWDNLSGDFRIKHGITDRLDIGVGCLYEKNRGLDGVNMGLKFGLIPGFFAISANGAYGKTAYDINAVITKGFGPVFFDMNLGMGENDYTEGAEFLYSFCCTFDKDRICAGAEIQGTEGELTLWQAGFSFELIEVLKVNAGLRGDFEEDVTLEVTTGLTFEFAAPDKF